MSRQNAAPVLTEDVFENGTHAGGETGSLEKVATTHTITIQKAGPTISHSSKPINDDDVVSWEATDFAANETLIIRPVDHASLFAISYPDATDKRKVKGVVGDGKGAVGIGNLTVAYAVIHKDSKGKETVLFSGSTVAATEDEPNLVIDKLGDPPRHFHPHHPRQRRS